MLKAIFGEKAGDVRDASLKAPPGMKGVVIDTKLFTRKKKDPKTKKQDKKALDETELWYNSELVRVGKLRDKKLQKVLLNKSANSIRDKNSGKILLRANTSLTTEKLTEIDFEQIDYSEGFSADKKANELVNSIRIAYETTLADLEEEFENRKVKIVEGDEQKHGKVQLEKVYEEKKRKKKSLTRNGF